MNYRYIYGLIFVVSAVTILAVSCTKDKVPIPEIPIGKDPNSCDECTPLQPAGNTGFTDLTFLDSIYFDSPQFNPNNDDEIVFIQSISGIQRLYKLNLITKQKTLIFEGHFSGNHISWGANDWILLPLMDFQIWKIKSDGTQLTQVTSNGKWFHPEWNNFGDKFIAFQGYVSASLYYKIKIFEASGTVLDSINCYDGGGDWNNSLGYGVADVNSISVFNTSSGELISDFKAETTKNYSNFTWISEYEALVTDVYGIYKYNILTKSLVKIKCSCNSKIYNLSSVNIDKTKVLFSFHEFNRVDSSTLLEQSTLYKMNVDGTQIEKIEIP